MLIKPSLLRTGLIVLFATFSNPSLDAQTGALRIDWSTIDAGGGESTTPTGLTLQGTIGQWDAAVSSSGVLRVSGGFWAGPPPDELFRDRFQR
ncbi:MAG: hypothetical protein V2J10_12605 [Wenzhouxiangella sp.]|jgi:hypothetical protein|nr:hypothetical protein [Wenzhouxiangella sp.]